MKRLSIIFILLAILTLPAIVHAWAFLLPVSTATPNPRFTNIIPRAARGLISLPLTRLTTPPPIIPKTSTLTPTQSIPLPASSKSPASSPSSTPYPNPLNKRIDVDITNQRLTYYLGDTQVASVLISSAARGYWTPRGTFFVQKKRPFVDYIGGNADGTTYNYPNTKWNLSFLPHYYIHGAYWHNNFGHPMSHGCVNVSYNDMEQLYNFVDVGTPVTIHD